MVPGIAPYRAPAILWLGSSMQMRQEQELRQTSGLLDYPVLGPSAATYLPQASRLRLSPARIDTRGGMGRD
jgi:hypothetical protein